MNSTKFKKVKQIYTAVLDASQDERSSVLQDLCGDDPDLRDELHSLLAFDGTDESFIDLPPDTLAAELLSERDAPDLSGQQVGQFKIISPIGKGGMATVYLAIDERLGRDVAVKCLDTLPYQFQDRHERFLREARAASSLNHPNILTVHDIVEFDGRYLIATEFIDGETLGERFENGPLDIDTALDIAIQVASALAAAHEVGIVHRDIKPDNIMIRADGLIKVVDFGIAKLPEPSELPSENGPTHRPDTKPGTIIGTTSYMSPEQVRGTGVTSQSDFFSFGVVLYEMLTGELPFRGGTPSDTMAAILTDEPIPVGDLRQDIPAELSNIVCKALEKDLQRRYERASDIYADLQELKKRREISSEVERSLDPTLSHYAGNTGTDFGDQLSAVQQANTKVPYVLGRAYKALAAVAIGLLLVSVFVVGYSYYSNRNPGQITSIAVMPFTNDGRDLEIEYLSDGLTESLINHLSRLPQVSVKARSSVFSYKGRDLDPKAIGKELGVQALLLGNLVQNGDHLVLNLELVDTLNGDQIWGQQYRSLSSDLITFQSAFSNDVLDELRARLSIPKEGRVLKEPTENVEAYRHYLQGLFYWNKRTDEDFRKAIDEFRAAVEIDPEYALAYCGLADSYVLLENTSGTPSSQTLPLAAAYAQRALDIDPLLPEAHASLAITLHRSWNWSAAEQEYKKAIELKRDYASVHHWYSLFLRETGRYKESLAEAKQAYALDPLTGIVVGNLAVAYIATGDADSAVDVMLRAIEIDPDFSYSHAILGLAYLKKARYPEALSATKKGADLAYQSGNVLAVHGYANAVAGNRIEALAIAKELEARYAQKRAIGQNVAAIYAGLGETDKAFAWLAKDLRTRSSFLPYIRWHPAFESLRHEPRFNELLTQMNMPS